MTSTQNSIGNKTSEAVDRMIGYLDRAVKIGSRMKDHEFYAICQKYRRMELALEILKQDISSGRSAAVDVETTFALSFDPLSDAK